MTGRRASTLAALALAATAAGPAHLSGGQTRAAFLRPLDEHPAIQYGTRPTTDRVATLAAALAGGARLLARDARTGYLRAVLDALDVPQESQLLVFSKTGVQRDYTSPRNPRALYFNESVVVGYIPGAPALELAAQDPQQGVVFYTLDQTAADRPTITRRTSCLACHVSAATLEVPGMIARSHMVNGDGVVHPQLGSYLVDHRTPHAERWGGWYVTTNTIAPPYQQLGHLGNLTVADRLSRADGARGASEGAIVSDRVFVEWLDSAPESRGYLSRQSDLAALLAFDHQMHAMNLLTRINWEARAAASEGRLNLADPALESLISELADYLLFSGEARLPFAVTPRPGLAERLEARFPKDRRGRSLGQLDLTRRLARYPCSYMIYSEAFDGLPPAIKDAVYRRMNGMLIGRIASPAYAHLSADDRRAVLEILRETKPDFPRS